MDIKKNHFIISPNLLPKDDPRYQKWLKSLKNRPGPWNKGKTKNTDERVRKTSETMRNKHIDNFLSWREKMYETGKWFKTYSTLNKSVELATLIGITLGDGNIYKFPRTEKLSIALSTDKPELISFVEELIVIVFNKKPTTIPYSAGIKAVRVSLYQKQISERLEIPSGKRRFSTKGIPKWIWNSSEYLIGCLKGLFEAEGSLNVHLPTYTYNFAFSNINKKLLGDVHRALLQLKLHPEVRSDAIRLRRKAEVQYFEKLITFRKY